LVSLKDGSERKESTHPGLLPVVLLVLLHRVFDMVHCLRPFMAR